MAVEYETLVQGGHSKLVEEIFKKVKDKTLVDEVKGIDSVPYHFRQTPYGDRLKEKIIGGTVAWNQLIENPTRTLVVSANSTNTASLRDFDGIKDHVYFASAYQINDLQSITRNTLYFYWGDNTTNYESTLENFHLAKGNHYLIGKAPESGTTHAFLWCHTPNVDASYTDFRLHDLTQMFGSAIADRLYTLEQATAGAGVALFRKLFNKEYYPFNPGELISVSGLVSHDEVGFNQWDEEWELGSIDSTTGAKVAGDTTVRTKNPIRVLPNTSYYIHSPSASMFVHKYFYDEDMNFVRYLYSQRNDTFTTPSNARYMHGLSGSGVTSLLNDICINLSDTAKNGTYEPYVKHSYPLDSSLTLRGVPMLVDNKIKFDGDVYESTGKVMRRYGIDTIVVTSIYEPTNPNFDFAVFTVSNTWLPYGYFFGEKVILGGTINFNSATVGGQIGIYYTVNKQLGVSVPKGTTLAQAQAMLDGTHILYELATPTEETAQPFQSPQRCFEGGTEEYVTTGIVPVGHESTYITNKAERFDALPDTASFDGDYIVRQENGVMELVDANESSKLIESEDDNPITFEAKSAQMANSTKLTFEPIQDLHGYDHPWPEGGGKNKLPNNLTSSSVVTVNSDGSLKLNGTTSEDYEQDLFSGSALLSGEMSVIASAGFPSYDSGLYIGIRIKDSNSNNRYVGVRESQVTINLASGEYIDKVYLHLDSGKTLNNVVIYPMIRLATESDAAFEPYSNICPISGINEVDVRATGFNLWDEETETGYWDKNTGIFTPSQNWKCSKNYIPCTPNTTYYADVSNLLTGSTPLQIIYYDADKNYIQWHGSSIANTMFTTPNNAYFMTFYASVNVFDGDICINISDPQRNGQYEPYHGTEVTSSLPETVYGGTLDLTTGELVVDMGMVDLGMVDWLKSTGTSGGFYSSSQILYRYGFDISMVCSHYRYDGTRSYAPYFGANGTITCFYRVDNDTREIYIKDDTMANETPEDFKAAMSGVMLAYELATPVTYHLTPKQLALFKGTNVVQTNAKSIKITYRNGKLALMDDIPQQLAIEEAKTDEKISTSIFPILGDFATVEISPSSANHAVGEYLIYESKLYKVTSAIAAGETLAEGTNIQKTTVMAELVALTS